jgi:23S rRNA (cytosine1962-C5)-methyltransferase
VSDLPPFIAHEDEHVLIVNKPPGWNTHSPSPYAGEGVYEWLKNREPSWSNLAIIHRLDKETSGLMIFSKTAEANRSLTAQFTQGLVKKEYLLKTDRPPKQKKFQIKSHLKRIGERYASAKGGVSGVDAITDFEVLDAANGLVIARPQTGRTHQIRVHASENGFPILGDTLYGGAPFERLCLHSQSLSYSDPVTAQPKSAANDQAFDIPAWQLRRAFIDQSENNAFRWINGATDGFPNWHLDQLGDFLLSQSPEPLTDSQRNFLAQFFPRHGVYHKITTRHIRATDPAAASPKHILGPTAPGPFTILENGVRYEMNFAEGYSTGLFLDQRDNRRRLLGGLPLSERSRPAQSGPIFSPLASADVLNTFSYTCAFSVCAALAGARVTSLDLSRKYLDWGRRNFQLNNLSSDAHDFIYGDVFDWLKRFAKKRRQFDLILLDPPTFSQSKESGLFRVERDFAKLIQLAAPLLKPNGTLFASSNAATWPPEDFLKSVHLAIQGAGQSIASQKYFPQPPDFPISKEEPAYLKTVWIDLA